MAESMKIRKLTIPQVRKSLSGCSHGELIDLLLQLYKECPEAANLVNMRLQGRDYASALLSQYKDKIHKVFFPGRRTRSFSISEAKGAVTEFARICTEADMILDLQLYFIECGLNFANRYEGMGDSFYASIENMFREVIDTLDRQSDRELFDTFGNRIQKIPSAAVGAGWGLNDALDHIYHSSKWITPEKQETPFRNPSRSIINEILPKEDSDLFFQLWMPLLNYINQKMKIIPQKTISLKDPPELSQLHEIAETLWNDVSLIDDYLAQKGNNLDKEHRRIISDWKKAISGRFVLERHLKKGSIFISLEDNTVYQVRGITTSWEEMLWGLKPPAIMDMTLIPFRDVIITDGLVFPLNIYLTANAAKPFKELYMTAKRRGTIRESL